MNVKYYVFIGLIFSLIACSQEADSETTSTEVAKPVAVVTEETPQKEVVAKEEKPAAHPGMELHEEHCSNCHKSPHDKAFYTREDRKVQSYEKLQGMVRMCDSSLGTQLFDEDMEQIGDYLNTSFYKFSK